MKPQHFQEIAGRYPSLKVALVGDFCLDRYLEIDPGRRETSIETGLPVHNVVRVRSQPGGAGTILNNLVALGAGDIWPVGFCGYDGEGYELQRALAALPGIRMEYFIQSEERHTFTYTKPIVLEPGKAPRELNRFDTKNWTSTSEALSRRMQDALISLAPTIDLIILLEQVDVAETGVVTGAVLETIRHLQNNRPELLILADSRRGLRGFPPVAFKMNRQELAVLTGTSGEMGIPDAMAAAAQMAHSNGRPVIVTLAEAGLIGAWPDAEPLHVPAPPPRGEIDIVGAGDSVTANLAMAVSAGATPAEALKIAAIAAHIVIHKLGTTGTASPDEILAALDFQSASNDHGK